MHNLKLIRDNPEVFKKRILDRNINIDIKELLKLDEEIRDKIQKKEKLEHEKKIISKTKDKSQFKKSKIISTQIERIETSIKKLKKKINLILNFLPNVPLADVPLGKDEKSNKELKKVGQIPNFNFKTLSHYEIGEKRNLIDFNLGMTVPDS